MTDPRTPALSNATPRLTGRKLVHAFLLLPWHVQLGIVDALGLTDADDEDLTEQAVREVWFRRARERNKLEELAADVEGETAKLKPPAAPPVAEGPAATPPLVEDLAKALWTFEGDNTPTWEECIARGAAVVDQYRGTAEFVLRRLGKLDAPAAAEPFTPNPVEGRAAALVLRELEHERDESLRQLDEARRRYDFLINDHPDDEHPPRYWENVEDGDRCIYCALESAEAANQELHEALEHAYPYVEQWMQANEDGWIEKKLRVLAKLCALLGPQHGDTK